METAACVNAHCPSVRLAKRDENSDVGACESSYAFAIAPFFNQRAHDQPCYQYTTTTLSHSYPESTMNLQDDTFCSRSFVSNLPSRTPSQERHHSVAQSGLGRTADIVAIQDPPDTNSQSELFKIGNLFLAVPYPTPIEEPTTPCTGVQNVCNQATRRASINSIGTISSFEDEIGENNTREGGDTKSSTLASPSFPSTLLQSDHIPNAFCVMIPTKFSQFRGPLMDLKASTKHALTLTTKNPRLPLMADATPYTPATHNTLNPQKNKLHTPLKQCRDRWLPVALEPWQKEASKKLVELMKESSKSQKSLQDWDHDHGLPKSHTPTMVNTARSRKQLLEERILSPSFKATSMQASLPNSMKSITGTKTPVRSPLRSIVDNERRKSVTTSKTKTPLVAAPPIVLPALDYPSHVSKPSRALIETLYTEAMNDSDSDQTMLNKAGVLSFEDVLLPAVAFQEEKALKKAQSKVQRDHPDQVDRLILARKEVYGSIGAAVQRASAARRQRVASMTSLEQHLQAEHAQQQRNNVLLKEANLSKRKNELRKRNPETQELWREVAYLTTEKAKLELEERMWKELSVTLDTEDKEIFELELKKESENNRMDIDSEDGVASKEIAIIEQLINGITISSTRIQQTLETVSNIVTDSDNVRRELYRKYRQDHQFEGYQGVNDAKGLLRALSQSQDII